MEYSARQIPNLLSFLPEQETTTLHSSRVKSRDKKKKRKEKKRVKSRDKGNEATHILGKYMYTPFLNRNQLMLNSCHSPIRNINLLYYRNNLMGILTIGLPLSLLETSNSLVVKTISCVSCMISLLFCSFNLDCPFHEDGFFLHVK